MCFRVFASASLSILCGMFSISASAQAPNINSATAESAVPKPGAGPDYLHMMTESVDPASGSLSLKITFPTPIQRGNSPQYSLLYNSGSVYHLTSSPYGSLNFRANPGLYQSLGWTDNTPVAKWTQTYWQPPDQATYSNYFATFPGAIAYWQGWAVCALATNFTFSGFDSSSHNLFLGTATTSAAYSNPIDASCPMSSSNPGVAAGPPKAGDGEAFGEFIDSNALAQTMAYQWPQQEDSQWETVRSGTLTPFIVTDHAGNRYTFSGSGQMDSEFVYESYPESIEDRNGNYFSWTDDSVGRGIVPAQPPLAGSSGSQAVTIGANSYTFSFTPSSSSSSYQVPISLGYVVPSQDKVSCPAVATGWNTISTGGGRGTIALPNGAQIVYYWGNYSDSGGGVPNSYDLISEIVYPSGGWVKYTWSSLPSSVPSAGTNSGQWQLAAYGAAEYKDDAGTWVYDTTANNGCQYWYSMPTITERQVSFNGSTVAQTDSYLYQTTWTSGQNWSSKQTTVTTTDNVTGTTTTTVHTYGPAGIPNQPDAIGQNDSEVPVEVSEQIFDGSTTGKLMRTIQKTWYTPDKPASVQTTLENGATTTTTYCYSTPFSGGAGSCNYTDAQMLQMSGATTGPGSDSFDYLLVEKHEFDYGVNPLSGAAPTRKTVYTYKSFPDPDQTRLTMGSSQYPGVDLVAPQVSTAKVYDSTGALIAETDYGYDESAPVNPPSGVIQHDPAYSTTMATRGNLTSVKKCIAISSGTCSAFATTTMTYDIAGQLQTVTDPLNNPPTLYTYTDSFSANGGQSDAYVTNITWPDGLTTGYTYRLSDGQLSTARDENGNTTTYGYDTMGRPNLIQGPPDPNNNGLQPTTNIYYDDSPGATSIQTTELMSQNSSSQKVKSTTKIVDGLGHVIKVQSTDPDNASGIVEVDSQYDGMGWLASVTNPYRPGTASSTDGSTTYTYDALGRMTSKQTQSDKATEWWCYLGVQTRGQPNCRGRASSLSGSWVDYQDQNGNDWQRVSDGLGRLVSVVEPDGNSKTPTSTMETDYTYSGLDDITQVVQAGASVNPVVRTFQYDPASRLTVALNPETGKVQYSYDLDGNLSTKTDARGIITTYRYDNRNRLISKSYSNDASGTPTTCYQYSGSGVTNGNGRLANEWTQGSGAGACPGTLTSGKYLTATSIAAYNPMGQITSEQQCTPATCTSTGYPLTYGYDLGGQLTSYNDGNGITFTQSYSSGGQLQAVWSSRADYPQCLYSAQMAADSGSPCTQTWTAYPHVPTGALQNAYFGSAMTLNQTFDPRLRITGATYTGTVAGTGASGHATVPITGQEQTQ